MTAFVPVQVRLVSPMSMGRSATGYPPRQGEAACHERAPGRKSGTGSIPVWRSPLCADPCPSTFFAGRGFWVIGQSSASAEPAGSNPAPPGDRWIPRASLARVTFDGSQDWVIVKDDAVAGSNPASGSKCRGSSGVEHVKLPVRSLSVDALNGPKFVDYRGLSVRVRPAPSSGAVAQR